MIGKFSFLLVILGIIAATYSAKKNTPATSPCYCDTLATKMLVTSKTFNRLPAYDTSSFERDSFYYQDSAVNRMLWYRDVENTDTTKFTRLWNDYFLDNYHADHQDFIQYYQGKKDVELAFQFGPNMNLWAYHIFVVKKIGCCYLLTRSYFRHARFTYKAWSVIDKPKLDSLFTLLGKINTLDASKKAGSRYCGYFADNRHHKSYYIEFEKEMQAASSEDGKKTFQVPKKEVQDLYDFIDKNIGWIISYRI